MGRFRVAAGGRSPLDPSRPAARSAPHSNAASPARHRRARPWQVYLALLALGALLVHACLHRERLCDHRERLAARYAEWRAGRELAKQQEREALAAARARQRSAAAFAAEFDLPPAGAPATAPAPAPCAWAAACLAAMSSRNDCASRAALPSTALRSVWWFALPRSPGRLPKHASTSALLGHVSRSSGLSFRRRRPRLHCLL